jgi:1-aminocyclopropane-1-carboxylate synthase
MSLVPGPEICNKPTLTDTGLKAVIPELAYAYRFSTMGGPRFPVAMATHLNEYFKPFTPVEADHIITASGLTAIHELVGYGIADPGEGILVSRPVYGRFELDFGNTDDLKIVYADMHGTDPFSVNAVAKYQETFEKSVREGVRIKAMLIVNPHNPLGACFLLRLDILGMYIN